MNYGFVRVGVGIPLVKVADPQANVEEIMQLVLQSVNQGVEILLTPELSLTGYTCQDLFHQQMLIDEAEVALLKLMDFTRSMDSFQRHFYRTTGSFTSSAGLPRLPRFLWAKCGCAVSRFNYLATSCSALQGVRSVSRYAKMYGLRYPRHARWLRWEQNLSSTSVRTMTV